MEKKQKANMKFDNSSPKNPVKLVFIHHSCGDFWLVDSFGRLGLVLKENNYYVSDTQRGWGPDSIGDYTDIGHWWTWFRGPESNKYLEALYKENGMHSYTEYTRLDPEPAGENEVVMFKSCFPNSNLKGSANDPVPPISENPLKGHNSKSEHMTVANAKGIYIDLLEYFKTRNDKLFIAVTAPPLVEDTYGENARAFNNWMVNEWLSDYPLKNVRVFDYFNILTSNAGSTNICDVNLEEGNHHRFWKGEISYVVSNETNRCMYPVKEKDSHPNPVGDIKATAEFKDLINIYYNEWKNA